MKRYIRALALILAVGVLFAFRVLPSAAGEDLEEVSTENRLYVRGLISKVYPDTMQISVRPPKGKSIRIVIDPDTQLEGVSDAGEFQKEQQVKVWYSIGDDGNKAIKIKKMMDLGC